jgi:superfamily II DNA/RNA helicase
MENLIMQRVDPDDELSSMIDALVYNEFARRQQIAVEAIAIDGEKFKKCVWLASVLASSADEAVIQRVHLFAVLGYLQFQDDRALESVTLLLLARIGNLTAASRHLPHYRLIGRASTVDGGNSYQEFDSSLSYEVANLIDYSTLRLDRQNIIATHFQKHLWTELSNTKGVSISGPTSSGKSFIIKKYFRSVFATKKEARCLYIVPSRALINQVSDDFHSELLGLAEIKTAFLHEPGEDLSRRNTLYVLTPERCLRLIQADDVADQSFDVIFIDEIQNVEEESGRGSILEYVAIELRNRFRESQIVVAGPNIENVGQVYSRLFNDQPAVVATNVSPVFQIKSTIRPQSGRDIEVRLQILDKRAQQFRVLASEDIEKKFKLSIGDGLAALLPVFAKGQQSIVYAPKTNLVENWAIKFAASIEEPETELENETSQLIEFLSEEIHPKYFLIECLKKKVAFHHGRLPDLVRKEIEEGYLDGRIQTLFCTSTLLQGVNLPAQNLFVVSAQKLTDELTPFEFGNLIGRAGRLRDSFYGTIFCIERDSSDEWAQAYYDSPPDKKIVTSVEKSLAKEGWLLDESQRSYHDIKGTRDRSTVVFLRQKFLKDKDEFRAYVALKGLPETVAVNLEQATANAVSGISLTSTILRANPSIDPLLQDRLYKQVVEDGIQRWCITPNSDFMKRLSAANVPDAFEKKTFYWQLVDIFERLESIFRIQSEVYFDYNIPGLSIRSMCVYGVNWINGLTYRELIDRDVKWYANHQHPDKRIDPNNTDQVNTRINKVINIYSRIVTHVLVKYLKLLNDIIEPMMNDDQRDKYKFHLSLPNSIELGSSEPAVRKLISAGVLRSVALKIFGVFKQVNGYENLDIVSWLGTQSTVGLKPIYLRYLSKLNLLKVR